MNDQNLSSHSITGAFVFLLLGLFAVMSSVLVLGGVRAYSRSAAKADRSNGYRILSSYARSRIRSLDEEDAVSVEMIDGVPVLTVMEVYDGDAYETCLYSIGGVLREWFSEAGNQFILGDGDEITDAILFEPRMEENGLLTIRMQAAPDDDVSEISVALRCAEEGK